MKGMPEEDASFRHWPDAGMPMHTLGLPLTITPPAAVLSLIRAAGLPLIRTVAAPWTIASGLIASAAASPTRAAGKLLILTLSEHGGRIGPPPAGHACESAKRAAGGPGTITPVHSIRKAKVSSSLRSPANDGDLPRFPAPESFENKKPRVRESP